MCGAMRTRQRGDTATRGRGEKADGDDPEAESGAGESGGPGG